MSVGLAAVMIAGMAAKKVAKLNDIECAMVDRVFEHMRKREYEEALGVLDTLQHETTNGMKCTPYAYLVRTQIEKEKQS
jgi:hypothetical protein